MGSRIMHYCITTQIKKHIQISDETRLHLGGLAPDLTHPIYAPKAKTHFVEMNDKGKKRTDLHLFIHRYKHHFKDSFYIGYLSHLVCDSYWYEMMFYKHIRPLEGADRLAAIDKGYRDFRRLNKILKQQYQLTQITNIPVIDNVSIDGLYTEYIPEIVKQLNDDFKEVELETDTLEIYNLESILENINLSISKTISLLSSIKS